MVVIVGTLVQDGMFVALAIGLAFVAAPPRAWHFGLRATRAWPAIGWTALAVATFLSFSVVYQALVGRPPEQTTLDDLGAAEASLAVGLLVIVAAPFVEEFFFRGFVYGALRTSLPIWAAALITGTAFGSVHVLSGIETVPILIVLGVIFCLLYERTGTLYAPIALHAVVNSVGFASSGYSLVAGVIGGAMLLACLLLPLTNRGRRSPLPSARVTTA